MAGPRMLGRWHAQCVAVPIIMGLMATDQSSSHTDVYTIVPLSPDAAGTVRQEFRSNDDAWVRDTWVPAVKARGDLPAGPFALVNETANREITRWSSANDVPDPQP